MSRQAALLKFFPNNLKKSSWIRESKTNC